MIIIKIAILLLLSSSLNSCVSQHSEKRSVSLLNKKANNSQKHKIDYARFIGREIGEILLDSALKKPIRINCDRLYGGASFESVTLIYSNSSYIIIYPENHKLNVGSDSDGPLQFDKIKAEKISIIRVFLDNEEFFYSRKNTKQ